MSSGYGHVHIRPVVPPDPEPVVGVGIVSRSPAVPPFADFGAPGSGGDPAPIPVDFYIFSTSDTECTVKARTISGNYTAGVDFTAVDESVSLPGTDEHPDFPGMPCAKVSVIIISENPGISLPYEAANASFTLELYDPTGCEIGGEVELDGDTYELLEELAACGTGI